MVEDRTRAHREAQDAQSLNFELTIRIQQICGLGRWAKRSPPTLQRQRHSLVFFKVRQDRVCKREQRFSPAKDATLEGALYALPTFPTCKFPNLQNPLT